MAPSALRTGALSAPIDTAAEDKRSLVVTVFKCRSGRPFGKIRGLNRDGTLRKDLQASLNGALCETRTFPTLMSFLEATWDLGSHQALAFGMCGHATAQVVSKKYIADQAMLWQATRTD